MAGERNAKAKDFKTHRFAEDNHNKVLLCLVLLINGIASSSSESICGNLWGGNRVALGNS